MKTKILILASNPKGTPSLELDTEIRDLRQAIKRAPDRDRFVIEDRLAVRPKDLQAALLEVKPRIVHFGGHGEGEGGLVLQNDSGQPHLVSTEALADLFRHFSHQIECVLLNACYSRVQAEEIVKHINFVIGMHQPILDRSAIVFSEGFYGALGAGTSIAQAYELGRNRIHLELGEGSSQQRKLVPILTEAESSEEQVVPEHLIPRLFINQNPTPIEQPQELEQISQQEIISRQLITTSPYKGLKRFESRDKTLAQGGVAEYYIGDRRVRYQDLGELTKREIGRSCQKSTSISYRFMGKATTEQRFKINRVCVSRTIPRHLHRFIAFSEGEMNDYDRDRFLGGE